jgi:hypothetical protein
MEKPTRTSAPDESTPLCVIHKGKTPLSDESEAKPRFARKYHVVLRMINSERLTIFGNHHLWKWSPHCLWSQNVPTASPQARE